MGGKTGIRGNTEALKSWTSTVTGHPSDTLNLSQVPGVMSTDRCRFANTPQMREVLLIPWALLRVSGSPVQPDKYQPSLDHQNQ